MLPSVKPLNTISNRFLSKPPPPKKVAAQIMLLDKNGNVMGHKRLQEAYAIAENKGMILMKKKGDHSAKYEEYILVDPADVVKEDNGEDNGTHEPMKNKEGSTSSRDKFYDPQSKSWRKKSETKTTPGVFKINEIKRLTVKPNISEHDVQVKCSQILKWIGEMNEVKVLVSGGSQASNQMLENIYNEFQKNLPSVRFLQKSLKNSILKFTLSPDPKLYKEGKLISQPEITDGKSHSKTEILPPSEDIDPKELEAEIEKILEEKNKK